MNITKLDRAALKAYFVKNAVPTASNFADLIEGMLNQKDDGIVKVAGEPLSVQADGGDQKQAIKFYNNLADAGPAWTLSLNPRIDPSVSATKPGWSIGDANGNSRLFIDQSTGNLGVGTVDPGPNKLNVNGSALFTGNYLFVNSENAGRLRVGAAWGMPGLYSSDDGDKPLTLGVPAGQKVYLGTSTLDAFVEGGTGNSYFKGKLGIGTTAPAGKLEVNGAAVISNGNTYATKNNRMAPGSLTVGSIDTSYGGGNSWNANTAALLFETLANTEIAVHDSGDRLASLLYYEGDTVNRITIGRNMGWGAIGQIVLNGNVSIAQQDWQPPPAFLNRWHNYGSGYNTAGYFKDSMGMVHLKGLVAGGLGGTTIFVLPVGYRPAAEQLHVTCTNNNTAGRLDIRPSGELVVVAGDSAWFSLDGVTFRAESFFLGQVAVGFDPIAGKVGP